MKKKIILLRVAVCALSLMLVPIGYANTISFDLTDVAADPLWIKTGSGGIVGNTIVDDLKVTRTTWPVGGSNDFMLEAVISSALPSSAGEAGARLWVRSYMDDLLSPNQHQDIQLRLMNEDNVANNFIGLYNHNGVLAQTSGGIDAKILLSWDQTSPRHRIRLMRQGDEIIMETAPSDAIDFDASKQSIAVSLNTINFPALFGTPNMQEVGFGNGLVSGNQVSTWESIQITTVPVPAAAWLFGSGLIGLIGVARRKKA